MKKMIPFSPPDITELEIAEVVDTLKSGWITTGPKTKLFETQLTEYAHCGKLICLNSATAALELTLRLLGIGEGDEVITSSYTYTASASVIAHVGAKIVLVDLKAGSYEMDYTALKSAITTHTKAIIPVDIGGVMCQYDTLIRIADECNADFSGNNDIAKHIGRVAIIADAAHSFGACRNGTNSGAAADFTCFSFHAVKNLTTGEGGAVAISNTLGLDLDNIYKQYNILSLHGQTKDALAKTQLGCWEYDIISPAFKCNMTDIAASIGIGQLKRYPEMLAKRHQLIECYNKAFEGSIVRPLSHKGDDFLSSGHLYITNLVGKDACYRNTLISKLAEHGISANVHYKPLPLLTAYSLLGFDIADFPNALATFQNELTLPLHTNLSIDDVQYVANMVLSLL